MRTIKVENGQTLADIALQYYGKLDGVFDLAVANYLDPVAELTAGQTLFLPELDPSVVDAKNVRFFKENNLVLASINDDTEF